MSPGPDEGWFYAKRYGFGSGPPRTWQGWLVTVIFIGGAIAMGVLLADRDPLLFAALFVPWVVAFMVIAWKTTSGGWKWRWGKEDETW
ncbi:hypothetical protein WJS89_08195 [Sphingomicrobium sp. XHP0235]|uniref:hypothetical protein n=1 Tax=Sphingomicrobium aquimarinum TaxID=3133971 RepID=UPI0031FF1665